MSLLWMTIVTVAILQASVFCTTIYLHRAKCHRGLELHPALELLMHLHITIFTSIVPREWVAVHRKHHHFSDKEGDPHSPVLNGMWYVLFRNFEMYGKEARNPQTIAKYTPEWRNDLLDRMGMKHGGIAFGVAIFILMFGWIWGPILITFHMIAYILLNAMINSLGHTIGYRNYENQATNLQWVALLTAGEGLHNNHHEFPTSARFALRRFEIDPAWPVIRILSLLRLAKINQLPIARAEAA